jgi:hypothetical protein
VAWPTHNRSLAVEVVDGCVAGSVEGRAIGEGVMGEVVRFEIEWLPKYAPELNDNDIEVV